MSLAFTVRLIAFVWLAGGIYIMLSSGFKPGLFGGVTAALGIPAAIAIFTSRRWAIVPSLLLCAAWLVLSVLFIARGSGITLDNIALLVSAVACAVVLVHWHRVMRRGHGILSIE